MLTLQNTDMTTLIKPQALASAICVMILLVAGCSQNPIQTSVHDAAETGDIARLQELVKNEPLLSMSRDHRGESPLHLAVANGELECVKFLMEYQNDINFLNGDGVSPIQYAIESGNSEIVAVILGRNPNLELPYSSPQNPVDYVNDDENGVDGKIRELVNKASNDG